MARMAHEFVHVVIRRGIGRDCVIKAHCTSCTALGVASASARSERRRATGLTRDLFADAERLLYPRVPYHRLTPDERRHCYIVARTWWLDAGYWQHCTQFNYDQAVADVAAMRNTLERRGLPVNIPSSPLYANVDAHD
jgi:hypothetical protein